MLHEFLRERRSDLIERCRSKLVSRAGTNGVEVDNVHGVPRFIDQLIEVLRAQIESQARPHGAKNGAGKAAASEMGIAAVRHGREVARRGYPVERLIHDYGDLCQAITDAAFEVGARIEVDEFRTLNRCLDDAIAESVSEWGYQSNLVNAEKATERLDRFVFQLRKLIHTATLAVIAMKAGNVGLSGATGAVLDRSLLDLRNLLDRSLGDLRGPHAATALQLIRTSVADFVAESKISASLEAQGAGCKFTVPDVDPTLGVDAEQPLLFAAVGQLLHNAFMFSQRPGKVVLAATASGDRIQIKVEDSCGGLVSCPINSCHI